jgi:hypothetical protein
VNRRGPRVHGAAWPRLRGLSAGKRHAAASRGPSWWTSVPLSTTRPATSRGRSRTRCAAPAPHGWAGWFRPPSPGSGRSRPSNLMPGDRPLLDELLATRLMAQDPPDPDRERWFMAALSTIERADSGRGREQASRRLWPGGHAGGRSRRSAHAPRRPGANLIAETLSRYPRHTAFRRELDEAARASCEDAPLEASRLDARPSWSSCFARIGRSRRRRGSRRAPCGRTWTSCSPTRGATRSSKPCGRWRRLARRQRSSRTTASTVSSLATASREIRTTGTEGSPWRDSDRTRNHGGRRP